MMWKDILGKTKWVFNRYKEVKVVYLYGQYYNTNKNIQFAIYLDPYLPIKQMYGLKIKITKLLQKRISDRIVHVLLLNTLGDINTKKEIIQTGITLKVRGNYQTQIEAKYLCEQVHDPIKNLLQSTNK